MKSAYGSFFMQQQKIEEQVSKKYGYSVTATPLSISKISYSTPKHSFINHNLRPLQIEKQKPEISQKHKKLLEQIEQKEHQKKMKKLYEQKNNELNLNIGKLMSQKIKSYNYVIDHKHIIDRNDEINKKNERQKTQTQLKIEQILKQINAKHKQLQKLQNLQQKKQMTKFITALYKKYKQIIQKQKNLIHFISTCKSPKFFNNHKIKSFSLRSKNKSNNYSQVINHTSVKFYQSKHLQKEQSNICYRLNGEEQQFNLDQPYIKLNKGSRNKQAQKKQGMSRESLQKCRKTIRNINYLLQLKEQQLKQKNEEGQAKNEQQQPPQICINPYNEFIKRGKNHRNAENDKNISELKNRKKSQQKYLSAYLQKRNRKFKKPWGNKILIPFNGEHQAKYMLDGISFSPVKSMQSTQFVNNTFHKSVILTGDKNEHSHKCLSYEQIPRDISQDDKIIIESIKQQKQDSKLNEIMRKNEKINLFLKSKRKNKSVFVS